MTNVCFQVLFDKKDIPYDKDRFDNYHNLLSNLEPQYYNLNLELKHIKSLYDYDKLKNEVLDINIEGQFKFGEVGIWLSNLLIMKTFLASKFDYLLILENDFSIKDFQLFFKDVNELTTNFASEWNIFSLHVPSEQKTLFKENTHSKIVSCYQGYSSAALLYSREGVIQFLERIRQENIKKPIDLFIFDLVLDLKVYSYSPRYTENYTTLSTVSTFQQSQRHFTFPIIRPNVFSISQSLKRDYNKPDTLNLFFENEKPIKFTKVLVYKSYGGLGDIFFLLPALYKLKQVCEHLDFALEEKHFPFFKKYITDLSIIPYAVAKATEAHYEKVIEYGNYPSFNKKEYPLEIEYITTNKVNQHAIQHYIDATCKFHTAIDYKLTRYPYFKYDKISQKKPYYVIHAGAGFIHKAWPAKHFAQLIISLSHYLPHFDCYVIKGASDPDLDAFLQPTSLLITYITGDLLEVGQIMEQATFFIGNDAGITHLAGAFNIPTVAIYGPTGPGSWGSFSQYNEIIWGKQKSCFVNDCNYHKIISCDHKVCLNSVTISTVIEALFKLLSRVYEDEDEVMFIVNPNINYHFNDKTLEIKIDDEILSIVASNQEVKQQLQLIFEKNYFKEDYHQDVWQAIDFFITKNIIFQLPLSLSVTV